MTGASANDSSTDNRRLTVEIGIPEYTPADFRALSSTNLDGFIYTTQLAVKQMLAQKTGGRVVSITASLADHPLAA